MIAYLFGDCGCCHGSGTPGGGGDPDDSPFGPPAPGRPWWEYYQPFPNGAEGPIPAPVLWNLTFSGQIAGDGTIHNPRNNHNYFCFSDGIQSHSHRVQFQATVGPRVVDPFSLTRAEAQLLVYAELSFSITVAYRLVSNAIITGYTGPIPRLGTRRGTTWEGDATFSDGISGIRSWLVGIGGPSFDVNRKANTPLGPAPANWVAPPGSSVRIRMTF